MKGLAIIVSPLIALMKNQVDVMNALFEKNLLLVFIIQLFHQLKKKHVKENILIGQTKLVYISPESFSRENNIKFLKTRLFLLLQLTKLIAFQNGAMILGLITELFRKHVIKLVPI